MRERRRLNDADLTPEQKAVAEARRLQRQTPEYQESLTKDVAAIRGEFPPRYADRDLTDALAALALGKRLSWSLTDQTARGPA